MKPSREVGMMLAVALVAAVELFLLIAGEMNRRPAPVGPRQEHGMSAAQAQAGALMTLATHAVQLPGREVSVGLQGGPIPGEARYDPATQILTCRFGTHTVRFARVTPEILASGAPQGMNGIMARGAQRLRP